jgi:hypothetical protein
MPLFAPSGWEKRISAVMRFGRRFQNPKRGSKRFRIRRPSQVMNQTNTTKQNALTRVHAGLSLRFKASGSAPTGIVVARERTSLKTRRALSLRRPTRPRADYDVDFGASHPRYPARRAKPHAN